jgi:hypothetical protein
LIFFKALEDKKVGIEPDALYITAMDYFSMKLPTENQ